MPELWLRKCFPAVLFVNTNLYPPIRASSVFSLEGRDKMICIFKLWHLFKLAELTESMRQKGDNSFIDLLNNIRIGEIEPEYEQMFKSKIISTSDQNYPWNALHLFAENSAVSRHNLLM